MLRALLPLLLLTPALTAQERVEAPDAGFAITIASEDWKHQADRSGGRLSALGIGPPELGGLAQITIQVALTSDDGVEASRKVLRLLRRQVEGAPGITLGEDVDLALAGTLAPGFALTQTAQGQEFAVRLHYLTAHGFQYRIQFHAPADRFDEFWPTAEQTLASFEFLAPDEETRAAQGLRALAARCGSRIDWAPDWERASQRASDEGKLIVVAVAANQGFALGNPLMEGPFSDPEVIALMRHRFVGLVWNPELEAPFVEHEVFGLPATALGTGMLLVTPGGDVVREIYLVEGELSAHVLRRTLDGHPRLARPEAPAGLDGVERIRWAIDRGLLEDARALLGDPPSTGRTEAPARALQRARLARIDRDFDAASAALDQVRPDAPQELRDQAELARADLLQATGDYAAALERAEAVRQRPGSQPEHQAQAMALAASMHWALGDKERTRALLEELCTDYPDEPPAWQAAAALTGYALKIDVEPNLAAFDDTAFALAMLPPPAPAEVGLLPRPGLCAAVDWLLEHQRADGSWPTPIEIRESQTAPSPVAMATQAIAFRALLEAAVALRDDDPERARQAADAAERGLRSYLARRKIVRAHPRVVAFMDYTCWGASYGIFGLTRVLELADASPARFDAELLATARAELQPLTDALLDIRQANGGWSYYLSGDVDGEQLVAAMSFTTATVLRALEASAAHGIAIDDAVFRDGRACLLSMRGTNEAFDYLLTGAQLPELGEVEVIGGAARGPLCAETLIRSGDLEPADLRLPLERYAEHLPTFGDQSRRALMHLGPQAQGSHYLMYDYATGAAALRAADPEHVPYALATRVAGEILAQMARCRSADGSFIDNPLIGAVAGTGLAIQALIDLEDVLDPER